MQITDNGVQRVKYVYTDDSHVIPLAVRKPTPLVYEVDGSLVPEGRIDCRCNHLIEYSKERIGKIIKASKCRVTLRFMVEEVHHTFTVIHSKLTSKFSVYFDGEIVMEQSDFFDTGLIYVHNDLLSGRMVTLMVMDMLRVNPLLHNYSVLISGVDAKLLRETKDYKEATESSVTTA